MPKRKNSYMKITIIGSGYVGVAIVKAIVDLLWKGKA